MSKIFGIASSGSADHDLRRLCGMMGKDLARKRWQHETVITGDHAAMGIVSLTRRDTGQPVVSSSGSVQLIYNGYFIYPVKGPEPLKEKGYPLQNRMAKAFLEDFLISPAPALRNLNGVFTMAIHDSLNQEICLVTDRLGLGLVFYHISGKKLIFASEVKAILTDPSFVRRINWKGWSDMFNLNWVSGNDTLFEGIFSLPPGTILKFDYSTGAGSRLAYWSEDEIRIDRDMAEEAAYHGCIERMRLAVRKFSGFRKNIILPLSGGNDSRFMALALRKEGIGFRAMTTNKDNYDTIDLVNAGKLSRLLGIDRKVVTLKSDLYSGYLLDFLEETDFMAPEHIWLSPLVQAFPKDAAVYDGFAGGPVLGLAINVRSLANLENLPGPDMDADMHKGMQKNFFNEPFDRIFRPVFYEKLKNLSLEAYKENGRPFCDNYLQVSQLFNRSRRGIGTYSFTMLNNYVLPVMPFVENEFFSFALSIPNKFRFNHYIFNRIVNEMEPGLEAIPTTRMGVDVNAFPRQARMVDHRKTIALTHKLLERYRLPDEFINPEELESWLLNVSSGGKNPFVRVRPYLYFCLWHHYYFR